MVEKLLTELKRLGITLVASGGRLRYRPRVKMTPELVDRLREHKAEILKTIHNDRQDEPNGHLLAGTPFDEWIQRPDSTGLIGWEKPDLSERDRWWNSCTFDDLSEVPEGFQFGKIETNTEASLTEVPVVAKTLL